jgi:hypothetical protein
MRYRTDYECVDRNLDIKSLKIKFYNEEDILDKNGRFSESIHPVEAPDVMGRNPDVQVLIGQVTNNPK